ncbi:fructose-6-phosphate aldolase [Spirosoma gilvum]
MKFFIDTANLTEIQEAVELGILDGVTTNPSLLAKEGIHATEHLVTHYATICKLVNGPISAELTATDFMGMIREGEALADIHPNIIVKVPMTKEGIKAINYFSQIGIQTNCTLVFSAGQAIVAAKVGATYVSPFIGRLDTISMDGLELIAEINQIYRNYFSFNTQILAASVRHPTHVVQCAKLGADVVTCPLHVLTGLLKYPLTNTGQEKFSNDFINVNAGQGLN